ncbi:MAG: TonB family protein [Elusimicrobia bacterium]|nr:TonB family protein [Elusimicrobiota bacterium]MDE2236484.1 TonB family protein [Elusimicrobiota bacterium]MDE2425414.1 TonB family protein [Elusimicrobiota bacterium]
MTESRLAPDFRLCLLASLLLHAGFLLLRGGSPPSFPESVPVEIDLTSPFAGNGPARRAAPKRLVPHAALPPAPVETPLPAKVVAPSKPPKAWTLPAPGAKLLPAPKPQAQPVTRGGAVGGAGTSHLPGGHGAGDVYGEIDGTSLGGIPPGVTLPKLLNRAEVVANLRRFYPERERDAGHEGLVVVAIHVGMDGAVRGVDVLRSAGPLFDAAARKVVGIMRFSPARTPHGPARAKIRQTMRFKLVNQ